MYIYIYPYRYKYTYRRGNTVIRIKEKKTFQGIIVTIFFLSDSLKALGFLILRLTPFLQKVKSLKSRK